MAKFYPEFFRFGPVNDARLRGFEQNAAGQGEIGEFLDLKGKFCSLRAHMITRAGQSLSKMTPIRGANGRWSRMRTGRGNLDAALAEKITGGADAREALRRSRLDNNKGARLPKADNAATSAAILAGLRAER